LGERPIRIGVRDVIVVDPELLSDVVGVRQIREPHRRAGEDLRRLLGVRVPTVRLLGPGDARIARRTAARNDEEDADCAQSVAMHDHEPRVGKRSRDHDT